MAYCEAWSTTCQPSRPPVSAPCHHILIVAAAPQSMVGEPVFKEAVDVLLHVVCSPKQQSCVPMRKAIAHYGSIIISSSHKPLIASSRAKHCDAPCRNIQPGAEPGDLCLCSCCQR